MTVQEASGSSNLKSKLQLAVHNVVTYDGQPRISI